MSEGTTLKWRRHQLSISERDALRSLTRRSLLIATRSLDRLRQILIMTSRCPSSRDSAGEGREAAAGGVAD
jgi:hypothetical protein